VIKNLKLEALQHQKNKRLESTELTDPSAQLADPRLRNTGIRFSGGLL
jgi:hypothetical protein